MSVGDLLANRSHPVHSSILCAQSMKKLESLPSQDESYLRYLTILNKCFNAMSEYYFGMRRNISATEYDSKPIILIIHVLLIIFNFSH